MINRTCEVKVTKHPNFLLPPSFFWWASSILPQWFHMKQQ